MIHCSNVFVSLYSKGTVSVILSAPPASMHGGQCPIYNGTFKPLIWVSQLLLIRKKLA